jgi:hypothetical protein
MKAAETRMTITTVSPADAWHARFQWFLDNINESTILRGSSRFGT